jgi:hypothetical protein
MISRRVFEIEPLPLGSLLFGFSAWDSEVNWISGSDVKHKYLSFIIYIQLYLGLKIKSQRCAKNR